MFLSAPVVLRTKYIRASMALQWQLVAAKRAGQTGDYEVQGEERLGAALTVAQINEKATDLGKCAVQWHRLSVDGSKGGPITGEQSTWAIGVYLTGLDLLLPLNRKRMV